MLNMRDYRGQSTIFSLIFISSLSNLKRRDYNFRNFGRVSRLCCDVGVDEARGKVTDVCTLPNFANFWLLRHTGSLLLPRV